MKGENSKATAMKTRRGFGAMDHETLKAIASKGGKAAHEQGTAHEFTSDEARKAGAKGGRAVAKDWVHMAEIGHKAAQVRARKRASEPGG